MIAVLSEYLTGSIELAAEEFGLSQTFVGFVILPIIGNAAEQSVFTLPRPIVALTFARLESIARGSGAQIVHIVVPPPIHALVLPLQQSRYSPPAASMRVYSSTAIVMAHKGKMDLAFGVALGSSTQVLRRLAKLYGYPAQRWAGRTLPNLRAMRRLHFL